MQQYIHVYVLGNNSRIKFMDTPQWKLPPDDTIHASSCSLEVREASGSERNETVQPIGPTISMVELSPIRVVAL
jgi:hypothetical protein